MAKAYKIVGGRAVVGDFLAEVPNDFIEYIEGEEPQELLDGLEYKSPEEWKILFISMTDIHIRKQVEDINKSTGMKFANIESFPKYAVVPTSPHYALANSILEWQDKLWQAVETFNKSATEIPTDAEFQAVLDGVVFAG